ncbi:MAG: NERD domain-containing protein [Sulfuricurvum sp.]|uniref:NERD domain-containing protein n=1 Tax=Sulfuricurvum sp. TaxID=2025608 RepID=UPI0025F3612A|nr:NERD domain-containing protein [Sulfuricurvum sp.]MBV5321394.1 NERD domain-containing protein [Sulfuricurvum sp.]
MLEVRKNTFSRSYENTFFRDFSRELSKKFADKSINGLLIGSPFCEVEERLQIDALLITTNVICIIDFKNFSGQINLPNQNNFKQGIWTNATGDMIKGGSSINPYIQLSVQKSRFEKVLKYNVLPYIYPTDTLNFKHADKVICFQEAIELIGEIPSEYMNFHITDKVHFLEKIMDIIDVKNQISLSSQSFEAFKKVFLADTYQFDEKAFEANNVSVQSLDVELQVNKLREDQKFALTQIDIFLKDPNKKIFILQGTLNSGKSHLIPYIRDLAYQSGIVESEIFASSARVARNLMDSADKVQSIYSYIYGGNSFFEDEKEKKNDFLDDSMSDNDQSQKRLKIIPLKACDNENNTLFIVDEAHLLSDSYAQTIDMRFGSGHLLKDFLEFSQINKTNRKIILIGDPYQLQIGGNEKSSLNPKHFEENYSLDIGTVSLLDNEDYSNLNQQALKCVQAMRQQIYNSLNFIEDKNISHLKSEEVVSIMTKIVHSQTKCPILTYTNEEAHKINMWIKKAILRNGEDLAVGDLITLHNNITLAGNSSSELPVKLFNGEFASVEFISSPKKIPAKKSIVELQYREIAIKLHSNGKRATILSLENFRLNPKAELSNNEQLAFKILLDDLAKLTDQQYDLISDENIVNLRKQLQDGKTVKTKLLEATKALLERTPDSDYYKFKNAAFIRFGWSMTVHRSMAYKFDEVIFNVDQGKNGVRSNESYFRWLYSGLCRAKEHVFLRNFTPITPWDNIEINEKISNVKSKDVFFESDNPDLTERLKALKEYITFKISTEKIVLIKSESYNYQERYFMTAENGHEVVLNISYDGKGHFKIPSVMKAYSDELKERILALFKQKRVLQSFDFLTENWRKDAYRMLSQLLKYKDIHIESIMQVPYRDKMKLFRNNDELEIDFYYDNSGLFSKIFMQYCSEDSLWNEFKSTIDILKKNIYNEAK